MKAYAIVVKNNETSQIGYEKLVESFWKVGNEFPLIMYEAITPDNVDKEMRDNKIQWNYPWEGSVIDFATGLTKTSYRTKNKKARMACSMSHFSLWQLCYETNEPLIIFEHDSLCLTKIDFDPDDTGFQIVGLNNPLGATRKSNIYYEKIMSKSQPFQLAPYIDDDLKIPQGLAGNSCYMIKPSGAEQLISLIYKYGLWPNDAIMCRQLVNGLGVSRKFYTRVQGLPSTTSD
jgi:GR25 family glycosyltransferase involved in LPS biosynthesis